MDNIMSMTMRTAVLDVLRYNVATLLDVRDQSHFDMFVEELPHRMARQFVAEWRVAGQVLAEDKVIAEYPATLWDHIKAKLGFEHRVKQVKLTEHVAFPEVSVPQHLQPFVRISWIENEGTSQ